MDIFVGNLPANMSVHDLRQLLQDDAVGNAHFRVVHKTLGNGSHYCYGRIRLSQPEQAGRVIREHQHLDYHGRPVEVREFIHRNIEHDRRSHRLQGIPWTGLDRRKQERRRRH